MGRGRIRPGSIASDIQGTIEEEPKTASPAAFVAGAKAIVPVLLAPIPFGVAFGATAVDNGLSTIEALGMSIHASPQRMIVSASAIICLKDRVTSKHRT